MRFRSMVRLGGKTATGIPVPNDVVAALGKGKRPAVAVTVGGYRYRTTVAPIGGEFFLPLSAEHRAAADVAAGDEIDVDIELDSEPRTVDVPQDLAAALDAAAVRDRYDALAYTHRKEHVRSIEEAKGVNTRARRIAKAVRMVQS